MRTGRDVRRLEGRVMRGLLRMLVMATGLLWAVGAHAAVVGGNDVNCRTAPRTNAKVVGTLRRGEDVNVVSANGAWTRVDPPRLAACWVRSDLLVSPSATVNTWPAPRAAGRTRAGASADRSYGPGIGIHRATRSPRVARSARSRTRRSRSQGLYDGGGSCPCSGGSVCVGPRGGRYCITSGGNKRYGV